MKPIYLCDKKQGACSSWKKFDWTECASIMDCNHTTNPDHALCNGCDCTAGDVLLMKCMNCPERKESQDD